MRIAAFILAVGLAVPANAAFIAENFKPVTPTGPSTFSVGYHGDSVVRQFWCAAGDYVMNGLKKAPATRIWRISGQRRGQEPIEFSLDSAGAQRPGIAILGGDGASLTAAAAFELCEPKRLFFKPVP